MKDNLTERDWRRLVEAVIRGNCILVEGSDVIFDPDDANRIPLTNALASKLAETLESYTPLVNCHDLAQVAQLRYNADGDRYDLELAARDFFAPYANRTTSFHRDLSALPFPLCLATSALPFMLNAFKGEGKSPIHEFYHYRKPRPAILPEGTDSRPIVYQLYGDLQQLDSLVLTETDLLEFLVNVVKGTPPLPAYVAGQVADPRTSFLFLGFGFQRWYARILLHVLQTYGHRNRSLAIEGAAFFDHPDSAHSALFFMQEHKIEFRHHSWCDFAAELRRRYEEQAPTLPVEKLPPNAPKVFLCYDHRDREGVMKLERKLHNLGIATWRDQQDLRGGEKWDQRIEQVVRKQVDYVLVLQTPNMLSRAETYIHNEITEALKRQKHFDQGEVFLIPAILERCKGVERLDDFQSVDLTGEQGLERLAKDIQVSWLKRKTRQRG